MNTERLLEVKYEHPDVGPANSFGWARESQEFLVLIQSRIEGYDLCTYVVIPKKFVEKVFEVALDDNNNSSFVK